MPIKKIGEFGDPWMQLWMCLHPEHNPPTMIVLEPGEYEHECPSCGKKSRFYVARTSWL